MQEENEVDGIDVIKLISKNRNVLITLLILSLALGVIYSFFIIEEKYKADTIIFLNKADASIAAVAVSDQIIGEIEKEIKDSNIKASYIKNGLSSKMNKEEKTLKIEMIGNDKESCYKIVKTSIVKVQEQLQNIYNIKDTTIIQNVQVTEKPYNVNHIQDILMSLFIGLMLFVAYLVFLIFIGGINTGKEIENIGLPFLGGIFKEEKGKKQKINYNKNVLSLKRMIAEILFYNKEELNPKTILFSGTKMKNGTSFVISNLAIILTKMNKKVLIIDNTKRTQHKLFGIKQEKTIKNVEEIKGCSAEEIATKIKGGSIYIASIYKNLVEDFWNTEEIREIIEILKSKFDVILMDGEPIREELSTLVLAQIVDTNVIVAKYKNTKIEELKETKTKIENANGKISGVILNEME